MGRMKRITLSIRSKYIFSYDENLKFGIDSVRRENWFAGWRGAKIVPANALQFISHSDAENIKNKISTPYKIPITYR